MPDHSKENKRLRDLMFNPISFYVSIFTLLGLIIGGFIYLTQPAEKNDTALQLQEQRIEQQQVVIDRLTKTQQNDTQEVKSEIAGLRTEVQSLTKETVKLQTIIEERIPREKVNH